MSDSPIPDQIALGLVVATHESDPHAAATLLHELDWTELMEVTIVLAAALEAAWVEMCETDDVDFDEFVQESGVWLAEMETP